MSKYAALRFLSVIALRRVSRPTGQNKLLLLLLMLMLNRQKLVVCGSSVDFRLVLVVDLDATVTRWEFFFRRLAVTLRWKLEKNGK